jgi:hypothetical protein
MPGQQLNLFRSRKQRGIAPPAPSEFQLHCAVADTIKRWIMPGWIYTHIASGAAVSEGMGGICRTLTDLVHAGGLPDPKRALHQAGGL